MRSTASTSATAPGFATSASPSGRFNAGQKLFTVVTAAFAVLFTVTGFLLWYGERDTRFRFANTLLIHDWVMYVSVILFAGHLVMAYRHRGRGADRRRG